MHYNFIDTFNENDEIKIIYSPLMPELNNKQGYIVSIDKSYGNITCRMYCTQLLITVKPYQLIKVNNENKKIIIYNNYSNEPKNEPEQCPTRKEKKLIEKLLHLPLIEIEKIILQTKSERKASSNEKR